MVLASRDGRHPSLRAQGLDTASPDFLGMTMSRVRFSLPMLFCSPKPMPETLAEVEGGMGTVGPVHVWGIGREERALLLWYPLFPISKHDCAITTDVESLSGRREASN